jgi:hypothetical protein
MLTRDTALKRLILKTESHSAAADSAIRLTSPKVPWLMISPSMRENAFRARAVTRSPV